MNRRTPCLPTRFFLAALLTATGFARAGELVDARFEMKPPRPYVNQPFEMHLLVEVTPGAELQDLTLDGFSFADLANVQSFQTLERTQSRHSDRTVDVLHYVSAGRGLKPAQRELAGVLRATVVERRNVGFFSSWSSSSGSVRMQPLHLEFRPLPATGIPAGFQGAIGTFTVTGSVKPAQAAPGDIVNLEYTLTGSGWLGTAQLIPPALGPDFRCYPAQESQRDDTGRLTLQQVIIPLTTNATLIGAARLPYFDPVAGLYRDATAGPFQLQVAVAQPGAAVPAVKRFDIQPPEPARAAAAGGGLQVVATMNQARKLMPLGIALLAAILLAGLLYGWQPKIAVAAGVVIFVAGFWQAARWSAQTRPVTCELRESAAARLCPAMQARPLFRLAAGGQVVLLEKSSDWVRIDANGRRGWIPAEALKP